MAKILKDKNLISQWLEKMNITNYTINEDLTVDVNSFVYLSNQNLKSIPIQFRVVEGDFDCSQNELTSLLGSPIKVAGDFNCSENKLKTLKHSPKEVGLDFVCLKNELITLNGFNCMSIKNFYCSENQLTDLQYGPKIITGVCDYSYNLINTLKYAPELVKNQLRLLGNQIDKINLPHTLKVKTLTLNNNPLDSIHYQDIEKLEAINFYVDNSYLKKEEHQYLNSATITVFKAPGQETTQLDFKKVKELLKIEAEKIQLDKTLTITTENKKNKFKV